MSRFSRIGILIGILAPLASLAAQDRPEAFTDPARAGGDFAFQGEYAGTVLVEGEAVSHGAQVVALGDGAFRMLLLEGGLPGAGWTGTPRRAAEGRAEAGRVAFRFESEGLEAVLEPPSVELRETSELDGSPPRRRGRLTRVTRTSPTLGLAPPEGAVVLFDGGSAEAFEGGRRTEDGLLLEGATSRRRFQAVSIHLEFRTPFMPRASGQARGNSGVYLQGRYEVQILDSFGLEGLDNECGAIYKISRPDVNACLPPLAWQTYDIDFTPATYAGGKKIAEARVSVRHNGIPVHEDRTLPRATAAAILPEGPEPGPLYLQDHGNPVRFRNVWVVERDSSR